jgi:predicted ABC-type ATPase
MKLLYIVRGLPGSGKSTVAGKLAGEFVYEADGYFYSINQETQTVEYNFDPTQIGRAHKWCKDQVEKRIKTGNDIAVANTFTQKWEVEPYIELAKKYGYDVQIITVQSNFKNVHGVPDKSIERMRARWENFTLDDF